MRTRLADVGAYCVAFELHCCVAGDVSALCARDWQAESGVACAWLDKGGGLQAAGETRRDETLLLFSLSLCFSGFIRSWECKESRQRIARVMGK